MSSDWLGGRRVPFWRQRLPFAGLFGAATLGILAAAAVPWGSEVFLVGFAVALAVWAAVRKEGWIYLAVACGFAVLQIWQTRESPATRLAERLGAEPRVVTAQGRVVGEPVVSDKGNARFVLRLESLECDGENWAPHCDVLAVVPVPAPGLGDGISLTGSLQPIPGPRNPGQFDVRRFMALRGIASELRASSAKDLEIRRPAAGPSLLRLAAASRHWMEATLREGIADDPLVSGLLGGIVLGVTSDIPDTLQDEFRQTGTFHLFSVSGLHVGMIAVILWQALSLAGLGRRTIVGVTIPALFFYALLTGWKPSSVRAATMSAIFLIGMVSSRQPIPINSLCAAGFVILAQATNELFSPGFQLSFAVVAAILLVAQPLQARIRRGLDPDPFLPVALWDRWQKVRHDAGGGLAGLLAVSVAAWLGSLPLTVYYFHMISLSALVANPVVVPLAFVIMATAMASLLGGVVSVGLAAIFNNANLVFTRVLIAIIQGTASLPGAFVAVGHWNPAPVQITVFDFGSGGAAAIESKGRLWLLDCGSTWDWENSISPWMRSIGKWSPDGLLLTHGDADHIGGALALLQGGRPEILIDSPLKDRSSARRKIHQFLEAKDRPPSIRCAGDCLTMSPCAQAFILHPPADLVANLADDKAFVVRVDGAGGKVLFLSDVGPATCSWLLDNQRTEMAADIVVLGRHRSGIAPDATFLHEVNPTLVVASAAGFPKNEPIDEKWAAMLEEMGIGLFRQDETGAVQLRLLPGHYEAEAFMTGEKVEHPFRQ